ncbi:MAG TPA: hypothetical protein DCY48_00130 [Candidatus Magasanikbacteria bacterium]|nr:MAG: hypothetical protein A3I74_04845 [Candidatus Magasanikbacteria bacterium RIFCSPLOWO2_02_FULL_47_16]OGH79740.1 MAG: hypothetical protein A3C10_03995 [Candidatus Magasanikbacteria bacterium RIFCSPHIGHO2_02_FULL_48_18]OGH82282.1 MAG: hypothetical protein A3G08_03315 [Candidatus Magasanikbacteria bacterium RIFCSPLOWO2_12_FULL_47_9b]HAZ28174.1 hypothetical protein [Candidatus Magasanikbacteria bacterium]
MNNFFVRNHPQLFTFLPATEVHPHDHFFAVTILRLFPRRITPNMITTVRVLMTPVVFYIILFGNYRLGIVLFLAAAFTDAIDGTMARTRNQITRFGMMFDPLADKFLIGSMVLLLVFRYFHFLLGIAILGLEIAIIASAFVIKIKFKKEIMANRWGKMKMLFQVIATFVTLLALLLDFPYFFTLAAWIFGLAIGFAILSLFKHGI